MVRHLHDIAGASIITAPGRADLDNAEVDPLVRKYMAGGGDVDGEYRTRLFHAIRDLTADAFGGWKQVTNVLAGGGLYAQRIVTRRHYDIEAAKQKLSLSPGCWSQPTIARVGEYSVAAFQAALAPTVN